MHEDHTRAFPLHSQGFTDLHPDLLALIGPLTNGRYSLMVGFDPVVPHLVKMDTVRVVEGD